MTVTHTVTHTVTTTELPASAACVASDLTGTFSELAGSAGAGNIVYTLKLTNASQSACTVRGIPGLDLLDANGHELPTSVSGNPDGPVVPVAPGGSATLQARFSPDVPGVGEGNGPCEPVAHKLRVTMPNESSLDVNIDPPTRVCSHGALQLTSLTTAD